MNITDEGLSIQELRDPPAPSPQGDGDHGDYVPTEKTEENGHQIERNP